EFVTKVWHSHLVRVCQSQLLWYTAMEHYAGTFGGMVMSHLFEVTDEEYQALVEASKARRTTPDALFHSWVKAMQHAVDSQAIDPEQWWYWTPEWQAMECEADQDKAAGHSVIYDSDDSFLAALEERSNHADS
ncbi:MAG: hypothetical protein ACXVA4_00260, partial [Ktedonobacterales bacterium]